MSRKKKESEKSKVGKFFSSVAKTGKSFGKSVLEATGPCVVCGKRTTIHKRNLEYSIIMDMNVSVAHIQGGKSLRIFGTRDEAVVNLYLHTACQTKFLDRYVEKARLTKNELMEKSYDLREQHRVIHSELELQIYDDSMQENLSLVIAGEEIMSIEDYAKSLDSLGEIERNLRQHHRKIARLGGNGGINVHSIEVNDAFRKGRYLGFAELFYPCKSALELIQSRVLEYEYPKGNEELENLFQSFHSQIEEVSQFVTKIGSGSRHPDSLYFFPVYAEKELSNMCEDIEELRVTFDSKIDVGKKKEAARKVKEKKEAAKLKAKAEKEAAEKKAKAKKEAAELKEAKLKQKAGMMKAGVPERIFSLWVEDILTKSQMLKMLQIFGESISDWELELEYICETEVNRFSHIDHGRVMFCPEYVREIETIDERITFLHDLISEFPKAMVRYSFENPTNQEQLEFLKRISTNDDFYYLYLAIINDGFEIDFSAKLVNDYGFDKHLDALQEVIDGANWEGVAAKHGFLQL